MKSHGIKGVVVALMAFMALFAYPVLSTSGGAQVSAAMAGLDAGPGFDATIAMPADFGSVVALADENPLLSNDNTSYGNVSLLPAVYMPAPSVERSTGSAPAGARTASTPADRDQVRSTDT